MISAPAPSSSAATNTTRPRNSTRNPKLGDPPRRRLREQLRDPDRGDHERDRQRQDAQPGVDRREPERDREEQRHREEQAGLEQVLEEERHEPAAQQPDPQDRGIEQRGLAGVAAVLLPREEPSSTAPPPRISQITGESPSQVGASGFGCTKPQVPGAQDPVDDQAEPERREPGADEVEAGAFLLRRVGGAPVEEQDDADDEHLADEDVAPRPVGGEQPADQRTDARPRSRRPR